MKLRRLDLKAFGPFTDQTLLFDSSGPGLHVIYGPNEAGKSSSLRALKALLYGFHPQTPDNFLHSYNQLLVGGSLENRAGQTIVFQRRKRRVNDLIDSEGAPLDQGLLAPFIHGVQPEIFEFLYGIDHESLVRGGREILARKGEVGQALFAAGAGISALREVIDQLEQEASGLFKSTGQVPEINRAIKRFTELQKDARSLSLSATQWKEHRKALKDAETERANLERDRDHKNREVRRLERLEQAIPELAILKELLEQKKALGPVTLLPPDFSQRYQQVVEELSEGGAQIKRDSDRLRQIEEKRGEISYNTDLLALADTVDDFHQRLGAYRKGQQDRPERNGMRIGLRSEAALLLRQARPDLPLEDVEKLRPALARKRTIQALSGRYEAISSQLSRAEKQSKAVIREQAEVDRALAGMAVPRESRDLLLAVKMAQKAGDVDALLLKNRKEAAEGRRECLAELKRIGLWDGDLEALVDLTLPLLETVQRCENEHAAIGDQRRALDKDRSGVARELRNVSAEIRKIEYGGDVPSEAELIRTREKREEGWRLLRCQWLDGEDVEGESRAYDPAKPLPEAYEGMVRLADRVADRLRHEAERVANAAAFRAQEENLQESLAENDRLSQDLALLRREFDEMWGRIWAPAGISPLSPKEMSGWLAAMEKVRYRVGDLLKKEREIHREELQKQGLRNGVLHHLALLGEEDVPAGDALGPVLVFAEAVLDVIAGENADLEKLRERRKIADRALVQAKEDLATAQEALVDWQDQWRKALFALGLNDGISPHEAVDYIDILQSCLDKVKEADDLQKRIDGIDRDAGQLEQEVRLLVEKIDPGMVTVPLEQAILQLRAMLAQARKGKTLDDKLADEIDGLRGEIATAEETLKGARDRMAELIRIAGCEKPEELAGVIGRFVEHQRLQEKISATRETLARIGAGASIEELDRQAQETGIDEISSRVDSLRLEITERIHPEINRVSQVIGEEITRLAAMDGGAMAADAAEKMEQELAGIRRMAGRYARLKLASRILQQEIERYREEHQGPVLKIASRYFADLTLGSFSGLKADLDDRGEPVLVGVRPGGNWVAVEGMSDGTCDQLFLALRMATLEWRLEKSESMPLIVDDILINFDDARSRATLQALADLSQKIQVILFTHHRQVVQDARTLAGGREIHIHELSPGPVAQ